MLGHGTGERWWWKGNKGDEGQSGGVGGGQTAIAGRGGEGARGRTRNSATDTRPLAAIAASAQDTVLESPEKGGRRAAVGGAKQVMALNLASASGLASRARFPRGVSSVRFPPRRPGYPNPPPPPLFTAPCEANFASARPPFCRKSRNPRQPAPRVPRTHSQRAPASPRCLCSFSRM